MLTNFRGEIIITVGNTDYSFECMLTQGEYRKHCTLQKEKKVTIMCAPIDKIRHKSAKELLEFCGQADSVPIDLNDILTKVGISALPRDFSAIEPFLQKKEKTDNRIQILGAIVMNGNSAAIFYNKNDKKDSHRCRFTIAHELAHCCLSHQCLDREVHIDFRIEGMPLTDDEKAANVFAGELLIPYDMLIKVIDKLLLPSVHTLANIFDVSDNVMLKRLEHLKITRNISGYNY